MAVKKSNTRIIITISNKQKKWIDGMCEKLHLKQSKLIAWLLWTKSKDVQETKTLIEEPTKAIEQQEGETLSDEYMEEVIKNIDRLTGRA